MSEQLNAPGVLYVVATPIGNLGDVTRRAEEVLSQVAIIAAEDTRRTRSLLSALGLSGPRLLALHEHNEQRAAATVIDSLKQGADVALVSDAGTPQLSDPGFDLIGRCFELGVPVVPVPGPSAVTAALSVCPLATVGFRFSGFLPGKRSRRRERLGGLIDAGSPVVFFEAPHRLRDCLLDLKDLAPERKLFIAREMTKKFETYLCDFPQALVEQMDQTEQWRGEVVCVLEGIKRAISTDGAGEESATGVDPPPTVTLDVMQLLRVLGRELPPAGAARLAAELTGWKRGKLYDLVRSISKAP